MSARKLLLFLGLLCVIGSPENNGVTAEGTIDANRLTYLDDTNPFHPGLNSARLTTPQWVGEPGVEAAVILSIDDMSDSKRYEEVLRPILDRLKKIDGRSPVSIFCNSPRTDDPQLQTFLREGVSLEIHTLSHPCPLLAKGSFSAAADTYHGCVDLLNHVPGNKPVAYRMPCCDSINSLSPRFFSEIFSRNNSAGQFLAIDSSVFNITTTNDPALAREIATDTDGKERFRKYLPFPAFTTTIDNYPYPYQIGKMIWEFPCAVPSDWEAQHIHQSNNPKTVEDWKRALDATVTKQGTFTLVFHPHGWIKPEQIVELIDYAVSTYGRKIKFLNFSEALAALNKNVLAGQSLRGGDGKKNGILLMDLNNDTYMDVVVGNDDLRRTRVWNPKTKNWRETDFPMQLVSRQKTSVHDADARFGILQKNGFASFIVGDEEMSGAWDFNGTNWVENKSRLNGLEDAGKPVLTRRNDKGAGLRFRDVDHDGTCELIVANEHQNAVFEWSAAEKKWSKLSFALPDNVRITDATGRDLGLRFVDVNEDGFEDLLFSNENEYSLHLYLNSDYVGMPRGWSHKIRSGKRGDKGEIPMINRGGDYPNNGAWIRNRTLWVQNENTADKPDLVERMTFDQLLELEAPQAKSPQESLATIKVRPGFKVELVAAEPMVMDPVAFEWGADGKLWVLEMGDYPLGIDGNGSAGGRVRFLEDTNHDGTYDNSTLFLEGLNIPSGLFPWRKGVLVLAAPDLFYAEDIDGDGKADVRRVLFTGFHPGNPQHRANGFDYGLDNWLYGANGDSGGEITSVATGKKVNINGRDFRFRPDTGEFEAESGQTQYGRHRDDWGEWFATNNPNWLWHYLFAERYIVRNPHLPVRENKKYLANYPDSTRVFAIGEQLERFNDPNGLEHVTSGNSPTPYRDDLFGPEFATSVFTSEPVHNCVHREVLEQDGTTFKSHRATGEEQSEFLASTDNWFRPTMTKTGPDGALYVADMYRLVIEHPEWISADRQKRIDLRAGADKGRIYRVLPEGVKPRAVPDFVRMNLKELVSALESPNGWQRDTAQRLLVERNDPKSVKLLENLLEKSSNPKTRLQALCTLEGLGRITPKTVQTALKDSHSMVRVNALRVSEPLLHTSGSKNKKRLYTDLESTLAALVNDADIRVRYQLAFTLGEFESPVAAHVLAKIALRDWNNSLMQLAVMSSARPHVADMTGILLADENPPPSLMEKLLGLATALDDQKVFTDVLRKIATPNNGKYETWQFSALAGFLDALEQRGQTLGQLRDKGNTELKRTIDSLNPLFDNATSLVTNLGENPPDSNTNAQTFAAIRVLRRDEHDILTLGRLLDAKIAPSIQTGALTTLKRINHPFVPQILLGKWKSLSPTARTETLNILFSRPEWVGTLLSSIERGDIPAGQIGTTQQGKLLTHSDESIKARATKLFSTNSDRQKVIANYASVASLNGDVSRGHEVFQKNCSVCHLFRDEGKQIGPDLGMMADKPIPTFLAAILDPNQAVEARYISYTATLRNDREVSGVIATETANSITIKNLGGVEETIVRKELQELKSSGLSLMPEGFENALSPQAMADLIAYLKAR